MRAGGQLPRLLKLLKEGKADVLPPVFAQSWGGLNHTQRGLLTALSIFVRPALEEALQATSGLDEDGFHESLEALMRLYLVKPLKMHEAKDSQLTGRRYLVHPFTRDFLEGRRTPADEGVCTRGPRHCTGRTSETWRHAREGRRSRPDGN